jgi:L-threonylcarbamoyladenylate synthase
MRGRVVRAKRLRDGWNLAEADLIEVIEVLKGGGLLVYPTDTLYGLGADPYDSEAVDRLYRVKSRPKGEPVSVAVSSLEEARRLARFSERALEMWRSFMPGPLTLILEATPQAPPYPITKDGALGLRMPRHDIPLLLAREFGPITATSANIHGRPAPRTVEEARSQLGKEVRLYIDAGPCYIGVGSTVVDLTSGQATIKREGALKKGELEGRG